MGRPTKFTEDRANLVLQALRTGSYRNVAASYAGISYTTLRNWLKLGEDDEGPVEFQEFLAAVEHAEATAEVADIAHIRQNGGWQGRAWVRERKNPERWGKREALEVTGADGGPVQVGPGLDVASIESLAAVLLRRQREAEALEEMLGDDHEAHRIIPTGGRELAPESAREA